MRRGWAEAAATPTKNDRTASMDDTSFRRRSSAKFCILFPSPGVLECWSNGVMGIQISSRYGSIVLYPSLQHSSTPSLQSSLSSRHFHDQIHERIDGDFMLGRYQRCGKWQLYDRRTAHGRADTEFLVIISRRVNEFALGPGKTHRAFALERGTRVDAALAFCGEFWLGDSTDGVDADFADLDPRLGVAGADAVELLIFFLEGGLHFRNGLGVETIEAPGHLDTGGLAAIAHGKVAAKFNLVRLESLAGHGRRHFLCDGIKPSVDHGRIGGHDVLTAHHACADDIGGGGAESGENRRGGKNIDFLDAQFRCEARRMYGAGAAEGINDKFIRQITCAYDLATN